MSGTSSSILVSNVLVKRFRSLRKFVLALSLGVCALAFLTLLAGRVEQYIFRRRVELLLSQIQSLELRETSWQEAQSRFQSWRANRAFDEHCDAHKCSARITLNEFVFGCLTERNLFIKLDDYFRWRLKLSYSVGPFQRFEFWLAQWYMRLGGHPARVIANYGMRDGTTWSKGISVWIETFARWPAASGYSALEFSLLAEMHSLPRFEYYGNNWIASQLTLHPTYMIGEPGGCEICVMGWVKFTPYTSSGDVHRLMQLDLSCLTRWSPCVNQGDLMPTAWNQHVAERTLANREGPTCSPMILEVLARDSANIAAAQVVSYRENFRSKGYDKIVVKVRVLETLKGMKGWRPGETREVTLLSGTVCAPHHIGVGSRLLFYSGFDRTNELQFDPAWPWPVLPMNETNLDAFRRGVAQDYASADEVN